MYLKNVAKEQPFLPLTEEDFDHTYQLESLPQCDYECPLCFMVKEDMLECLKCQQGSCRSCLSDYTRRQATGNV